MVVTKISDASTLRGNSELQDSDHQRPKTLHEANLRTEEDYVLAFIKETNFLHYLVSLCSSWIKDIYIIFIRRDPAERSKAPSLDASSGEKEWKLKMSWGTIFFIFCLKALLLMAKPFDRLGMAIENTLNLVYTNGGVLQTLCRSLFDKDALRIPQLEDDDYYSLLGLLDPRQDLQLGCGSVDAAFASRNTVEGTHQMADLCMMASKLAYENRKVIERVVNKVWKMNFVMFFDCWNEYLESKATQAYIFTDKHVDANVVVLAFRGTQPFNMFDWCSDFDFSYYVLPEMGRVHVGFLEALGLGNRLSKDSLKRAKINSSMKASGQTPSSTPSSGLSPDIVNDDDKLLAYDTICAKIRVLLRQNLGAKLYVTGHSLGGALAALFTGLLLFEHDHILYNLKGVFTFGQPRVGDAKFAQYMHQKLCSVDQYRKYYRVVYRTDVVPRVPFDDHLFQFKHIPPCFYYNNCSYSEVVQEEPYKSLLSIVMLPSPHVGASKELCISLYRKFWLRGDEKVHEETLLCLLVRFLALFIPGICAHSPSCYLDALRGAASCFHEQCAEGNQHKRTTRDSLLFSIASKMASKVGFGQSHGHNL